MMTTLDALDGKVFMTCSACMSVWADGLSWANAHPERIVKDPGDADIIVVLSCQVTDLAILNDLRTLRSYAKRFPNKRYFVSGCLGKRDDVPVSLSCHPWGHAKRLETPREPHQFLTDKTLVHFEEPFWVSGFNEKDDPRTPGHLFREMYPLRIGKGCPNKCTYCTIRITRGDFEQYDTDRLRDEFLSFDNVLLTADSPTADQIRAWCAVAQQHKKGFSVRNVEPSVVVRCQDELCSLARNGLLSVFHCPVQSDDPSVLKDMNRSVDHALASMEIAKTLKSEGTYIATNIIVDYKNFAQDFTRIYETYDYVSWNPFWDGTWNAELAETRFETYLGSGAETHPTLVKIRELEARARQRRAVSKKEEHR